MGRPTGLLGLFFDTEGPEPLDRNDVVVDEVEGVLSADKDLLCKLNYMLFIATLMKD